MKLVAVTMIKNEEDIVEQFVRHHSDIVDEIFILDHNSTDRTARILAQLQQEGLPLHVCWMRTPVYDQAGAILRLVREAVERLGADGILMLDCDEFVVSRNETAARLAIEKAFASADVLLVPWVTYVVEDSIDVCSSAPVLQRMRHRLAKEAVRVHKAFISSRIVDDDLIVRQGNHNVERVGDLRLLRHHLDGEVALCHFPIRSATQARCKYLVGWLANVTRGHVPAFDWAPYHFFARKGEIELGMLATLAAVYNDSSRLDDWVLVDDPVETSSGASELLRYTPMETSLTALTATLDISEEFAFYIARFQSVGELITEEIWLNCKLFRDVFAPGLAASDSPTCVQTRELADFWHAVTSPTGVDIPKVGCGDSVPNSYLVLLEAAVASGIQLFEVCSIRTCCEALECQVIVFGEDGSDVEIMSHLRSTSAEAWNGRVVLLEALDSLGSRGWCWSQSLVLEQLGKWSAQIRGKLLVVERRKKADTSCF